MTTPPGDDERFEHIPWEHIGPPGDRNKLILYGLAGAVVIAGLTTAVVGGRGASTDLVPTPTTTATATVATMEEVTTVPTSTSMAPGATAPNDDQPDDQPHDWGQSGNWSEADLRAFPPETLATEAAALAEWLVSDFFTIDGGTQITADLEGVFPEGSVLPEAPVGTRSFVEWARAVSVEESAPGHYEVLVVVRRLAAAEGESYRRLAPIGVLISLTWTEGGWSVTDLPVLAEAPLLVQAPGWSEDEVPADIIAAATASTGGAVLAGIQVGDNWRLVIQVVDVTGVSWPLVTWWDETGNRISAPAEPAQP